MSRSQNRTSMHPWKSPNVPTRQGLRRDPTGPLALVRSMLKKAGKRPYGDMPLFICLGDAVNQGTKRSSTATEWRALLVLGWALALSLPTLAMTIEMSGEPPAPSDSQCALIEVHDTAGIGWWSSAALDIDPAP